MGAMVSSREEYKHHVEANIPTDVKPPVRGWEPVKDDDEPYTTRYVDISFDPDNDFTHKAFLRKIAMHLDMDSFEGYDVQVRYIKKPFMDDKTLKYVSGTHALRPLIEDLDVKFVIDIRHRDERSSLESES